MEQHQQQIQEWSAIESDPIIFTKLINELGVKGISVEEIYSLDDQNVFSNLKPIYGLILMSKWEKAPEKRSCLDYYDNDLFFANQVIPNVSAIQAILSILLNSTSNIHLGDNLTQFKAFCQGLDSQTRGLALIESENLRKIHNHFLKAEPFLVNNNDKKSKKGDGFHYVSFVPFKNRLYELDGLQEGPIILGEYINDNWIDLVLAEINPRIQKYLEKEIKFMLVAICANKKDIAIDNVNKLFNIRANLYKYLMEKYSHELDQNMIYEANEIAKQIKIKIPLDQLITSNNKDSILLKIQEVNNDIMKNNMIIQDETNKNNKYHTENLRRKHNYIPFLVEMLKLTAKKGKLKDLIDNSKEKVEIKPKVKDDKDKQIKEEFKKQYPSEMIFMFLSPIGFIVLIIN